MLVDLRKPMALVAVCGLSHCVSVEQVTPAAERLPGVTVEAPQQQSLPAFVGLELRESLAGSLAEMSFDPGLEVVSVSPGSPALQAGLRRGDRVVAADGVALERVDQWGAVLDGRQIGDTIRLEVERDGGRSEVAVTVASGGSGRLPVPTRFVEHWKARLVVRSRLIAQAGAEVVAAEILELRPDSPLEDLGCGPGTLVLTLAGEPVAGAGGLVAQLARCEWGETVELEVLRDGAVETVTVELWAPPRRVTRVGVPILLGYEADVEADEVRFTLLDLWVLSLFEYRREGPARSWSVLRWLRFETGIGELVEVPEGAGDAEPAP